MTALRKSLMTVDEFLPWAASQPERWELFDGVAVSMSPERVIHGDTKYRMARTVEDAIGRAKVPCRFVLDSAAVRIDARNSYQPDLLIYCGEPVSGDATVIPEPIVVVEVLSPGNAMKICATSCRAIFSCRASGTISWSIPTSGSSFIMRAGPAMR